MLAKKYNLYAHIQKDLIRWGWEHLDSRLLEKKHILEVGAGTGLFTNYLVEKASKVVATDVSTSMCELGCKNVSQASWAKLDAFKMNSKVEKNKPQYDCIASSSFLHWAPDPLDLLQTWKLYLVPHGLVLAFIFTKGTISEFISLKGNSIINWKTIEDWRRIFVSSGFEILCAEEEMFKYTFNSTKEFFTFLRVTGTPPGSRQTSIRSLLPVYKKYQKTYPSPSGGLLSSWSFGLIIARKRNTFSCVRNI